MAERTYVPRCTITEVLLKVDDRTTAPSLAMFFIIVGVLLLGSCILAIFWSHAQDFLSVVLSAPGRFLFASFHFAGLFVPLFLFVLAAFLLKGRLAKGEVIAANLLFLPFLTFGLVLRLVYSDTVRDSRATAFVLDVFGRRGGAIVLALFGVLQVLLLFQLKRSIDRRTLRVPGGRSDSEEPEFEEEPIEPEGVTEEDAEEDEERPRSAWPLPLLEEPGTKPSPRASRAEKRGGEPGTRSEREVQWNRVSSPVPESVADEAPDSTDDGVVRRMSARADSGVEENAEPRQAIVQVEDIPEVPVLQSVHEEQNHQIDLSEAELEALNQGFEFDDSMDVAEEIEVELESSEEPDVRADAEETQQAAQSQPDSPEASADQETFYLKNGAVSDDPDWYEEDLEDYEWDEEEDLVPIDPEMTHPERTDDRGTDYEGDPDSEDDTDFEDEIELDADPDDDTDFEDEIELDADPDDDEEIDEDELDEAELDDDDEEAPFEGTSRKKKLSRRGRYHVPIEGLLDSYEDGEYWQIDEETRNAAEVLRVTLEEFQIQAEVTGIRKGPVITMFEILPAPGVKLNRIVNLADNIALRLAASSVRIVAPIPGKHAVGIEVPNKKRAIVSFGELITENAFNSSKQEIPIALGKDIPGDAQIVDLTKTPHVLIAGATGSGKSVCVNSIICSVLYRRTPAEVKMILIDPKIVELKFYNDIPHLLTPVITDPKKAFQALQYCIYEMERRYSLLDSLQVRDVQSYNRKIRQRNLATEPLPYIVVVVDEFADLMATAGKELESTLARLAAMSRAVGIHLVLATQRPSTDVITGLIKANIPSRIAFMVASKVDSRIIIDTQGAEKLLGRGDMLFTSAWDPFPVRMQGAFLSEDEVERIVEHVKTLGKPEYIDDEIFIDDDDDDILQDDLEDPLMEKAIDIVVSARKASASYLQRRLKVGYNRAARMVEEMERMGIVGPQNGSKPRDILNVPDSAQ